MYIGAKYVPNGSLREKNRYEGGGQLSAAAAVIVAGQIFRPYFKAVADGANGMYFGNYEHTIDDKGRLFVPAKLREKLGETFIVTRHTRPFLLVYDMEAWENLARKISELPETRTEQIRHFLFPNAQEVTPDKQGRIMLEPLLKQYAGFDKSATFLGVGNRVEIWSTERWKQEQEKEDTAGIAQSMFELGF